MTRAEAIEKFRAFVDREGDTLGRLLFRAERRVIERSLKRFVESSRTKLSFAEILLMQQLCLSDMRLTQLADRLATTKQAAAQLVDGLVRKGVVVRRADPDDGRAKLIGYTAKGYRLISHLIDATLEMEREFAEAVGPAAFRQLKETLAHLDDRR